MNSNSTPISCRQVAELLAIYETNHNVENYWAFGWQVWPFLRATFASEIHLQRNYQTSDAIIQVNSQKQNHGLKCAFTYHQNLLHNYIQWLWKTNNRATPAPNLPCDVLVFGGGQRYQVLGGQWIHYPTDPFTDLVEQSSLRCRTWQWGAAPLPAARASANILPPIRAQLWLGDKARRFAPASMMPSWFPEVAAFYEAQTGQQLSWEYLATALAEVFPISKIMEKWLLRASTKLLVVDWWANGPMVAATLAAHRLGIPVMDLQHGIQEQTDGAYHWWCKAPVNGWPSRPDIFWVWGERAEKLLKATNTVKQEVLRGGNPWLQKWLLKPDGEMKQISAAAKSLTIGYSRSILVTLMCPATSVLKDLKDIILRSPADWVWLIRAHPREQLEVRVIEEELSVSCKATVRGHKSSDWPLYALLKVVDLHVTDQSTCSNEAMVFGKVTILTSKTGAVLFSEYVNKGLMFYLERAEDFQQLAERAFAVDPDRITQAAQSVFVVDSNDTSCAINRIIEIVQSKWSDKASSK